MAALDTDRLSTPTGAVDAVTLTQAMQSVPVAVDTDGNMWFVGGSGGFPYGGQCLHEGSQNIDISAVGQGVYIKITGFDDGLLNNVTVVNDAFRVGVVGVYKIDWDVSADSQGTGKDYEVDVFINGVEQDCASGRREFGAVGSLGSISASGLFRITDVAHDIELRIKEVGAAAGTDIDIFNMNFNIVMVGG